LSTTFSHFTGETVKKPYRRSYSSGYQSGTPAPPTPVPTFSPTKGEFSLEQAITFTSISSPADYTGDTKKVYERGYALSLGLYTNTSATAQLKPGVIITSTAAAARRAGVVVSFVATVPPAMYEASKVKMVSLAADASSLVTNINKANTDLGLSVTAPSQSQVTVASPSAAQFWLQQILTYRNLGAKGGYVGDTKAVYDLGYKFTTNLTEGTGGVAEGSSTYQLPVNRDGITFSSEIVNRNSTTGWRRSSNDVYVKYFVLFATDTASLQPRWNAKDMYDSTLMFMLRAQADSNMLTQGIAVAQRVSVQAGSISSAVLVPSQSQLGISAPMNPQQAGTPPPTPPVPTPFPSPGKGTDPPTPGPTQPPAARCVTYKNKKPLRAGVVGAIEMEPQCPYGSQLGDKNCPELGSDCQPISYNIGEVDDGGRSVTMCQTVETYEAGPNGGSFLEAASQCDVSFACTNTAPNVATMTMFAGAAMRILDGSCYTFVYGNIRQKIYCTRTNAYDKGEIPANIDCPVFQQPNSPAPMTAMPTFIGVLIVSVLALFYTR